MFAAKVNLIFRPDDGNEPNISISNNRIEVKIKILCPSQNIFSRLLQNIFFILERYSKKLVLKVMLFNNPSTLKRNF